jgi:hypothetical protein
MPTIASSNVPPPTSWDEFESIMLAAAKIRWQSSDFYRNGRTGQKQDGIDVWGHDEDRVIGIQCKNTVGAITLDQIEDEISKAEAFTPQIHRLYIATTAPRDAPLQKAVRDISAERHKNSKFRVEILFWDDVCQDLSKDDDVFFAHYPQFRNSVDPVKAHDKKLFDDLTTLLTSRGVIGFLDRTNMAGFSFPSSALDPLREFYYEWNVPEREFISPELEGCKQALWKKVDDYLELIATETFPAHNQGRQTVLPDWETEQPERFWRVVNALHSMAGEIVSLHADLVRTGRAILVGNVQNSD